MSKAIKAPDVKAPRFRQKAVNVIDKELFGRFREKYPKHKNISESQFKKIVKAFNEAVWETVIETRDGVQLPEGIGCIFIGTCENTRNSNIDFAKSHKYGVTVTNKNWETDGKLAKIFYSSYATKYKFSFRECWSFTACRNFKRAVAKSYPENWTMYVQVDSQRKLRNTYTSITLKNRAEKLAKYNEFDL